MSVIAVPKAVQQSVKSDIYDALRNGLTKPASSKSKKSWSQDFIEKMLNEAKKNPNGPLGQMIARQIMQEDILRDLDAATDKYLSRDIDFNEYRIMKTLYHEQQEVYNDRFSNRIICIGSRRIGKSELAARLAVRDALHPNHSCIYINLKFENAIRQCFNQTVALLDSLGIPYISASKSNGEIVLANGSVILYKGNHDKASADSFLGGKYSLAIIDEVQNQCNVQYLIDTVLAPTVDRDYENGQIICLGTPPRIPHTYCEKIWKELKGWKHYGWDMSKNPFLHGDFEKIIKGICEEKGVTEDAPFIQREYLGLWSYDAESRVIKNPMFYTGGNDFVLNEIRNGRFKADYIYAGVDFGFSDYNAIVPIAWDKTRKIGYILNNYKFNRATVTEIVEKMKYSLAECQEVLIASNVDPHNIMYYGDNSDKSIIFELMNNYQFPIQVAYKHNKMEALSALAELCRRKIYTPENSALSDEYEMMVYKRDEETDAILPELDDDVFHADSVMALLYGSRALVQFHNPLGEEDAANIDDKQLPTPEQDDSYLRPEDITPSEFDNFVDY